MGRLCLLSDSGGCGVNSGGGGGSGVCLGSSGGDVDHLDGDEYCCKVL